MIIRRNLLILVQRTFFEDTGALLSVLARRVINGSNWSRNGVFVGESDSIRLRRLVSLLWFWLRRNESLRQRGAHASNHEILMRCWLALPQLMFNALSMSLLVCSPPIVQRSFLVLPGAYDCRVCHVERPSVRIRNAISTSLREFIICFSPAEKILPSS